MPYKGDPVGRQIPYMIDERTAHPYGAKKFRRLILVDFYRFTRQIDDSLHCTATAKDVEYIPIDTEYPVFIIG